MTANLSKDIDKDKIMIIKGKRSLREKLEDYDAFLAKFEAKKTTDDCYTPRGVYEAVADYVFAAYDLPDDTPIVRPFYPGGDYEHADYPEGCVVIDNPPFSIFSKIVDFYVANDIKFFIFCPALTAWQSIARRPGVTLVNTFVDVKYANGAIVRTSFATNLSPEYALYSAPELRRTLLSLKERQTVKIIERPDYTLGVKELQYLAKVQHALPREQMSVKVSKAIRDAAFGGVALLSEQARADMLYSLALPVPPDARETITLTLTEEDEREVARLSGTRLPD